MLSGGTLLFTMSPPWSVQEFSASLTPCLSSAGKISIILVTTNLNQIHQKIKPVLIGFSRGPGVAVLVLSWVITLYTLWQMVEMHEMVPGKRFDRYHELGQHAFGEKLGLYIVVPQQLIVEIGVCIVYMVTGGKSLKKFHELVCEDCKPIKLTYFIMIYASVHFVLSHLPNFNSISGVSLAAAVMSLR